MARSNWYKDDPRLTFSKGSIIIYTGSDCFLAFFNAETDDFYYIHIQTKINKYKRIAPGAEVEEWPEHWWWSWPPMTLEQWKRHNGN